MVYRPRPSVEGQHSMRSLESGGARSIASRPAGSVGAGLSPRPGRGDSEPGRPSPGGRPGSGAPSAGVPDGRPIRPAGSPTGVRQAPAQVATAVPASSPSLAGAPSPSSRIEPSKNSAADRGVRSPGTVIPDRAGVGAPSPGAGAAQSVPSVSAPGQGRSGLIGVGSAPVGVQPSTVRSSVPSARPAVPESTPRTGPAVRQEPSNVTVIAPQRSVRPTWVAPQNSRGTLGGAGTSWNQSSGAAGSANRVFQRPTPVTPQVAPPSSRQEPAKPSSPVSPQRFNSGTPSPAYQPRQSSGFRSAPAPSFSLPAQRPIPSYSPPPVQQRPSLPSVQSRPVPSYSPPAMQSRPARSYSAPAVQSRPAPSYSPPAVQSRPARSYSAPAVQSRPAQSRPSFSAPASRPAPQSSPAPVRSNRSGNRGQQ